MNTRSWIDHLFPTRCLLCGSRAGNMRNLCDGCHHDLPVMSGAGCVQCALPLARPGVCGQCQQQRPAFTSTIAALRYEGSCETLVHRFKFGAEQAAGKILATALAQRTARVEHPDMLVPIPLSVQRLRSRGFDHSWELARWVAKILGLSTDFVCVRRTSDHVPQSSLTTWAARRRNVSGVFHVEPSRIDGKYITIVDDVMTSGATVNSLARQLMRAGARRVDVWVPCRAGLLSDNQQS